MTSISIPNSVTTIDDDIFEECSKLTSISIPNSIPSIGDGVFVGCEGLTSITIGNGVTYICGSAFILCDKLSTINYNGTADQWESISKASNWHTNVPATTVHCTYGDVTL